MIYVSASNARKRCQSQQREGVVALVLCTEFFELEIGVVRRITSNGPLLAQTPFHNQAIVKTTASPNYA
jgi:hypothetical protein